jgi:hypothetical protein
LVNSAGNVGIGTSTLSASSSVKLTVAGDLRIGTSTTVTGCLQSFGGGVITGTCSSDQNLKTDITAINNVISKFAQLNLVNFKWNSVANALYDKNQEMQNTGFIAQNVEALFPELVITDGLGYKQVKYSELGLYAIEGVKELSIAQSNASTTLSNLGVTVANNYAEASSTIASIASSLNANYLESTSTFAAVFSLITSNNNNLQSQLNTILTKLNITNAPVNAVTIASNGTVGIGNDATQLGDEKLRVSGRVRATGFDIDVAADLAENFEPVEAVDAGTVVAFSTSTVDWAVDGNASSTDNTFAMSTVRKAKDANEAVGVISTRPGIVLGRSSTGVPVAFSGRIPVKVTTENGEVKQGDYLTVSRTMPGYAMKLTGEGRAIGRALSDYAAGRDKVLMIVENGLQKLDLAGKTATTTGMLTTGNIDLNANGVAITNIKSLASANGTWSIDENGRIVAKQLCLEDLCIDKNVLTNILQVAGASGQVLGASTSTSPSATSSEPVSTTTDSIIDSSPTASTTPEGAPSSTEVAGTSTPPVDSSGDQSVVAGGSDTPVVDIPPQQGPEI